MANQFLTNVIVGDNSHLESIDDELFWDDLLDSIDQQTVIPIVGHGATTIGPDSQLLAEWLTPRFAEILKLDKSQLPKTPTLNDIVIKYLYSNQQMGDPNKIYMRMNRILEKENPGPGDSLRRLAAIDKFNFFISATFDSLLSQAINEQRYGGKDLTQVYAYRPRGERPGQDHPKDLPGRMSELPGTSVYHIFGKASKSRSFVIWEDDIVEFILGLYHDILMGNVENLAADLKDRNYTFLFLGLSFSDWLVRFFFRTVRQFPLTEVKSSDYFAEQEPTDRNNLVMFFSKKLRLIQCDPSVFIEELHSRCLTRSNSQSPDDRSGASTIKINQATDRYFFLSYYHEDEQAALKLKHGLEAYNIPVWLDSERLAAGNNYENTLEEEVSENCSYFISLISKKTNSIAESYFHKERYWASKRAQKFAELDRGEFYIPVIIDDLRSGQVVREPSIFKKSHNTRLPDGKVTAEFANRLLELIQKKQDI